MKFTYYALFSIIFLLVVFVGAATLGIQRYDLATDTALKVAFWTSVPVGVFVVCAGLMLFYKKLREIMAAKRLEKDFTILADEIYTKALSLSPSPLALLESSTPPQSSQPQNPHQSTESPKHARFSHKGVAEISKILARFALTPKLDSPDSGCGKIDKLLALYDSIAHGQAEDLRKQPLSKDNPFALQNQKNHIQASVKNALEAFCDKSLAPELRQLAFSVIMHNAKEKELLKALQSECCDCLDVEGVAQALEHCISARITLGSPARLCKAVHFSPNDYLALAKSLQNLLNPDEWLAYFEKLASDDENAQGAYLFVLIELEMIEQAQQELKSFRPDEMLGIRAYLELKRLGKPYPLHAFSI